MSYDILWQSFLNGTTVFAHLWTLSVILLAPFSICFVAWFKIDITSVAAFENLSIPVEKSSKTSLKVERYVFSRLSLRTRTEKLQGNIQSPSPVYYRRVGAVSFSFHNQSINGLNYFLCFSFYKLWLSWKTTCKIKASIKILVWDDCMLGNSSDQSILLIFPLLRLIYNGWF